MARAEGAHEALGHHEAQKANDAGHGHGEGGQ